MTLLPSVLLGDWVARDLLDWLKPNKQPECLPEHEEDAFFVTPLEVLEARALARGLGIVDYRDLDTWPRNKVYDWREFGYPGDKSRAHPYGTRDWNHTTAIWVHTTDTGPIGAHRFLGIPCHGGIAGDATIVLCHHPWRLVPHGHAANRFAIGIEISGRMSMTPEQRTSARQLIEYYVAERTRNLDPQGPFTGPMAIGGHFMSFGGKPCPGEELFRDLVAWGVNELGLQRGPVVGTGRKPPEDWWRL